MLKIVRGTPSPYVPWEGTVSQGPDEVLAHIQAVLAEVRDDNARADRRAAGLLGAAVFGGLAACVWSPGGLPGQTEWLWWTGGFLCVMGILTLAAAIHPLSAGLAGRAVERRRSYAGRLHAWSPPAEEAPAGNGSPGRSRGAFSEEALAELRARMSARDTRVRTDALVLDIRGLSAVAHAKRRYIRRGVFLLLIAAVCCLLSVAVGQVIQAG
ncbi:hypothetical protein GCM10017673_11950 [Streptosporangium violaceochromogenes]|nr:hypothetical protein GCM10017673_11950 [Streptosporangium violaceochromogenes]